ncbi:MAG TPA: hypothetical protein VIP98_10005 [Microlunatus sp.]
MSSVEPVLRPAGRARPRFGTGPAVALVVGSALALLGMTLMIIGGGVVWVAARPDGNYVISTSLTVKTPTAALTSDTMSLSGTHGSGLDWAGQVRITAVAAGAGRTFVGIAHADDVARYLRGTAHDLVDTDGDKPQMGRHPQIRYQRIAGDLQSLRHPGSQSFWTASAQGTGWQTIDWNPTAGDWVVVVANANGSLGVNVTLTAGILLPTLGMPVLGWAGWVLLGAGMILLAVGVLVIASRAQTRRGSNARGSNPSAR